VTTITITINLQNDANEKVYTLAKRVTDYVKVVAIDELALQRRLLDSLVTVEIEGTA
jgi:nucleotidyltransferase/DNA polymerase involved in DNA repair